MKRVVAFALALGTFACVAASASAENQPCGPAFIEQKVICYKAVYKQRTVPMTVNRQVAKVVEEPVKYVEMVSVTTPEQRTEKFFLCVPKDVPFTYRVHVPITVQQTRTVAYCDYVPRELTRVVPVCRPVQVQIKDPCTQCVQTIWQYVTEYREVKCLIHVAVPKTKDVVVNVPSFKVEDRVGTKRVHELVPQSREVTVHVVSYRPVEKTGVVRRLVCETVVDQVNVLQTYCEMVPYEMTVRIRVACPCP